MAGKITVIIGRAGSGKTTFTKKATQHGNLISLDLNNEYNDLPELKEPFLTGRARYTGMDFKKFLDIIEKDGHRKVKNCKVIFEDCSGFLKGQTGARFIQIIQAKRHTFNDYYFLFHAVEFVPKDIYRLANYVILFKTNETVEQITKRYPALERAAWTVGNSNDPHTKYIVELQ